MKIYTVIEANDENTLNVYSFKTRSDAEEFILSCVEEDALNWFNHNITWAPVPVVYMSYMNGKIEPLLKIRVLNAIF